MLCRDWMFNILASKRQVASSLKLYKVDIIFTYQSQGDKNYLAPIEKALPDGGKDKRLLDIGTGSGVWWVRTIGA